MWQRLKCWIGRHEWGEYRWATETDRVCRHCHEAQTLRLVHGGTDRMWLSKQ